MSLPVGRNARENAKFFETLAGDTGVRVTNFGGLSKGLEYDFIDLSYTSGDLTGVVFKQGGSGGTTVLTFALTYSAGLLATVTAT